MRPTLPRMSPQILLVEDDGAIAGGLQRVFAGQGWGRGPHAARA